MSANRQHLQYYIASTIEHVTNQYYQSTFIYSLATYLLAATTGVQTRDGKEPSFIGFGSVRVL